MKYGKAISDESTDENVTAFKLYRSSSGQWYLEYDLGTFPVDWLKIHVPIQLNNYLDLVGEGVITKIKRKNGLYEVEINELNTEN